MKFPPVSIITPLFNSERFIESYIANLKAQNYSNLEIILIDGLSTDNTLNYVKEFASQNPKVKFISEPDKGIYDAMNKGIKMASGDWLFFMGCDDLFYDEHIINNVFLKYKTHEVDFIYGYTLYSKSNIWHGGSFDINNFYSYAPSHQSIFYRRTVFEKLGFYNIKYNLYADWEINIKCFSSKSNINLLSIPDKISIFNDDGISHHSKDTNFALAKPFLLLEFLYDKLDKKTLDKIYEDIGVIGLDSIQKGQFRVGIKQLFLASNGKISLIKYLLMSFKRIVLLLLRKP